MSGAILSCDEHGDLFFHPDATPGGPVTTVNVMVMRDDVFPPHNGDPIECPLCHGALSHRFAKPRVLKETP